VRSQVLDHLEKDCTKVVQKCQRCHKVWHRDEWAKHMDESKECAAANRGPDFSKSGECTCHQDLRQLEARLVARLDALERWQVPSGFQPPGSLGANGAAQSSSAEDGVAGGRAGGGGQGGEMAVELAKLLQEAGLASVAARRLIEEMGLVDASDLGLLQYEDVQATWLKPVQRRKLLALCHRVRLQEQAGGRGQCLPARNASNGSANAEQFTKAESSAPQGASQCSIGSSVCRSPAACFSCGKRDFRDSGSCHRDEARISEAQGNSSCEDAEGSGAVGGGRADGGSKRKRAT